MKQAIERKRVILIVLVVILALLATGCMSMDSFLGSLSFGRASAADRAKSELIGRTRGQILSCAGVPDRTIADGDTEFFTYVRDGGTRSIKLQSGMTVTKQRNYEVTIEFREGVVYRVIYSGSAGNTSGKKLWQKMNEDSYYQNGVPICWV